MALPEFTILKYPWVDFILKIIGLSGLTQALKSLFKIREATKAVACLVLVSFFLSWLRYKSGFWYIVILETLVFSGLAGALWDFIYKRWSV